MDQRIIYLALCNHPNGKFRCFVAEDKRGLTKEKGYSVKHVLDQIQKGAKAGEKQVAILLDPDELSHEGKMKKTVEVAGEAGIDHFFIGGSLIMQENFSACIETIKTFSNIPVTLFPGSPLQIHKEVDAILFLSLISGRNPETLIGYHVISAPKIKAAGLEVLPTVYMLVESGRPTTASYMSNTEPIPRDKEDIAACTAMAGEMLGLRLIYMDGGSGAEQAIPPAMIKAVRESVSLPMIVGGGIRSPRQVEKAFNAGANVVVVGNAVEKDPALIFEIGEACNKTA